MKERKNRLKISEIERATNTPTFTEKLVVNTYLAVLVSQFFPSAQI
jgi:hypothetical protein